MGPLGERCLGSAGDEVELSLLDAATSAQVSRQQGIATVAILDSGESAACSAAAALCLHEGRFRVRALWRVPSQANDGAHGLAGAAPLSSETGWFWFFDPGNLELMVKVLDASAINQSHWVFYGVLSDVEVFLVVEDLAQGLAKLYHRPAGNLCGAADTSAFPSSSNGLPVSPQPQKVAALQNGKPPLLLDRFSLEVEWKDSPEDALAPASSVALTGETALQWFFSPGNCEMATKILDGTAINGHYWLFSAALTHVQYRLLITDTLTGDVRTYDSEQPFCGLADIEAFPHD